MKNNKTAKTKYRFFGIPLLFPYLKPYTLEFTQTSDFLPLSEEYAK